MDQEKKAKAIGAIVNSTNWNYIEEIVESQLVELKSIDSIEVKGDAHGLEVEVRSRQLAAQTVRKIMAKIVSYSGEKPEVTPATRSMR